jgi:hypothetical protein
MSVADTAARLKQTCVLFQGDDGSIGSGYIVAPGHVATAAHVVRSRADGETFDVLVGWPPFRRPAQVTLLRRDTVADAAVLSLCGCDDIEPLPIGWAASDDMWRSFGFPVAMSLDREKVNGVHLSGKIIDMHYADSDGTPQIALYNEEAITKMNMRGASGAPLTVGGGVVGHLAQQYGDHDNLAQSVSGQLKACPIKAVLDLLPPGVLSGNLGPAAGSAPASALAAADVDMADLVSWCDRIEVTSALDDWLETGEGGGRLMCLVGHSDHRYAALLNRIATQLSARKVNKVLSNACHMLDAVPLGDPRPFRRSVETTIDAPFDRIDRSLKFRGNAGLVLLSHCCDWPTGPVKHMENHLLHLAKWLAGLQLGKRRLVLVLSLRYEDGTVHSKAAAIVSKAVMALQRKHPDLKRALLGEPIPLSDYRTGDVRNWMRLPLITMNLGRNLDRIEGALDEHYANETWNPKKLHYFVKKSLEGTNNGHQ